MKKLDSYKRLKGSFYTRGQVLKLADVSSQRLTQYVHEKKTRRPELDFVEGVDYSWALKENGKKKLYFTDSAIAKIKERRKITCKKEQITDKEKYSAWRNQV